MSMKKAHQSDDEVQRLVKETNQRRRAKEEALLKVALKGQDLFAEVKGDDTDQALDRISQGFPDFVSLCVEVRQAHFTRKPERASDVECSRSTRSQHPLDYMTRIGIGDPSGDLTPPAE